MSPIRKRGKRSYEVAIELPRDALTGERRRRTLTIKGSEKDAERAERDALFQHEHGVDVEPSRITVEGFLHQWLEDVAKPSVAISTYLRYRSIVRRLVPLIGQVRLQQLRPLHVQSVYASLGKTGLSAQTVLHYHRMLHSALARALALQLISVNPASAVTPPRVGHREARALTPEEIGKLLRSIDEPTFRHLVQLAVETGARLGELLALRWSDLDAEHRQLRISRSALYVPGEGVSFKEPKTASSRRTIMLARRTAAMLREHRAAQSEYRIAHADVWTDLDLIFPGPLGDVAKPYLVSKRFTTIAKAAGFEDFTFHGTRHSHATALLRGGIDAKLAAASLGHSNAALTQRVYQHVQPALEERVADAVDVLFAETERPSA